MIKKNCIIIKPQQQRLEIWKLLAIIYITAEYIIIPKMASDLDCNHVRTLNYTDQCGFVMNNTECQDVDGYLNYVEILYCQFGGEPQMAIAAMLVFLIWLCILFTGLAISADDYFCPNLASISKTLR